jgi:hypothetical protein
MKMPAVTGGLSNEFIDEVGDHEIVVSATSYEDAATAVSALADARFPVENVVIAARDLTLVEPVRPRRPLGRVAVNGLLTGAVVGGAVGFISWALGISADDALLGPVLAGVLLGGTVGLLLALAFQTANAASTETAVPSASSFHAKCYDVLVPARLVTEASATLTEWAVADGARRLRHPFGRPDDPHAPARG